jgi:hypothetical protein
MGTFVQSFERESPLHSITHHVRLQRTSSSALTVWERQDGRTRYVVAMLGDQLPEVKNRRVTYRLPVKAMRADVLFEGRRIAVEDGQFTDHFDEPFTVRVYRLVEE